MVGCERLTVGIDGQGVVPRVDGGAARDEGNRLRRAAVIREDIRAEDSRVGHVVGDAGPAQRVVADQRMLGVDHRDTFQKDITPGVSCYDRVPGIPGRETGLMINASSA